MDFCKNCNNMMYIESNNDSNLIYICKCCKYTEDMSTDANSAKCISNTMYTEDDLLYQQNINPYLRFDPTLPRVQDNSIKCENKNCSGPEGKPQIIYIKYHPVHMKYLYVCDYCGYTWRNKK